MTLTAARQVADAVLYEGYLLYPYRASSSKNQVRWQFGVLGPRGAAEAGVGEPPEQSAEVLLEARPGATVDVLVRFLQVQNRVVERRDAGGWTAVDELLVGGTRWIPFHEAVAREVPLTGLAVENPTEHALVVPGGDEVEELRDGDRLVGRLVRTRWPLRATLSLVPRAGLDPRLRVLGIRVANDLTCAPDWTDRDVAARHSLVGTHLLVTCQGTDFVSLLEGPDWSDADARACAQQRCWPVLVADDDGRDAVLVAPIILGDHPTIAPESAGDLFDATEIDEILTLRIMTLTEDEKEAARGTDPRAAAILARCDAMSDEAMGRLHGAQRGAQREAPDLSQVPVLGEVEDDVPWWDADQDARAAPESDGVLVDGVRVARGSRVLLRPRPGADAQDLFLAGQVAVVARVYFDVDGGTHLAVVLEDDPAADLWESTGRFSYFRPEEVEPLPARTATGGAR